MLAAVLAASVISFAAEDLARPLAAWRSEIEERGGQVVIVRVPFDRERNVITLPDDTPQRAVLRRYFMDQTFLAQFAGMHAVSVNYDGPEGRYHFILLNMARAAEWEGAEDALIGHELGHAWLAARGYLALDYRPGPESCLAVHAGDVVQHILIRREMERRGIAFRDYWVRVLDRAWPLFETPPPADLPACRKLERLALWLDVRLGLSRQSWERFERFDAAFRKNYPALAGRGAAVEERLRGADLEDLEDYWPALWETTRQLAAAAGFEH